MNIDDAITRYGLEIQFLCTANITGWDPIYQKNPVHMAAKVHSKALADSIPNLNPNLKISPEIQKF